MHMVVAGWKRSACRTPLRVGQLRPPEFVNFAFVISAKDEKGNDVTCSTLSRIRIAFEVATAFRSLHSQGQA